jgi:membrane protease YdiL (CAAX protease family)
MPDHPTPLLKLALAAQFVFCFAGLLVWMLILFRPSVRRQFPRLPRWAISFGDFLGCALCVVAGAFLFPLLAGAVVDWFHRKSSDVDGRLVIANAAMHLGVIAGALVAWLYVRLPLGSAGRREPPTLLSAEPLASRHWPLAGVLTFFAVLPATYGSTWICYGIIRYLHLPLEPQETLELLVRLKSRALVALFFVLATAIAPISEELVFRAGFFRYLRIRAPRWIALLLPSVVFAMLHVEWRTLGGLISFIPLVVLAVIFSLAYERSGRIGVTMIAHALFNLNSLLLILLGLSA